MKRILTLALSLIVMVTLALPVNVFAESFDKGLENAIKIAKAKFTIPDNLAFESSISTEGAMKMFYLSWRSEGQDNQNYNVTVDENGVITNYNHYKDSDYIRQKKLPTYSKADAKAIADKFIADVAPQLNGKLRDTDANVNMSINDTFYYFTYIRVENNIPLYSDQVSINVSRYTGEVGSYWLRWTDKLTFPDSSRPITLEKAQQAYTDKLGLRLIYKYSYDDKKLTLYPVYVNKYNNNFVVDALTGSKLEVNNSYNGPVYTDASAKMNLQMAAGASADTVSLTPEEQKAVRDAGKIITVEKAEQIARSLKYFSLKDYKISYSSLSRNWPLNDGFNWSLSFTRTATKTTPSGYANVTVDAVTGAVKSFYTDRRYVEGEVGKINAKTAKTAVEKFLQEFKPDLCKQVVFDEVYNTDYSKMKEIPATYSFTFTRKVGNILFPDNSMNIGFDAVSGKIVSFDMTWFNTSFPSVSNVIKTGEAYKTLFSQIGLELQYVLKTVEIPAAAKTKILPPVPPAGAQKPVLAYALKPEKSVFIDANKGVLLDSNGKELTNSSTVSYTDIAGDAAEKEIKILAEYGISLGGTEFKPKEAITQKDFLILLSKAMGDNPTLYPAATDKEIEDMYANLIKSGVVKTAEKAPAAKVTREDAVKFIIRALKYDKLADMADMFNCAFKDKAGITPGLVGYATIAGNLKLVDYGNVDFGPKVEVTRGAAAVLIYKYLQL